MAAFGPPGAAAGGCCPGGGSNTVTVTTVGCNSLTIPGVQVDMILGGVTLASGISAGQVNTITRSAAGSGYTNGTGFPLAFSGGGGSGAAGVFNVSGGAVTTISLTNSGGGYSSAPTVSFASSAGGTGAAASVTLVYRVVFPITSAGDYTFNGNDTLTSRFGTGTRTITITLPASAGTNVVLPPASNYVCWQCGSNAVPSQYQCAYPVKKVLNVTVPGGSGTSTWNGSNWQFPVTIPGVLVCQGSFLPPTTGSKTFTHVIGNGPGSLFNTCYSIGTLGTCGGNSATCTWAPDGYTGTTGSGLIGCTTDSGFVVTCPGPTSLFTFSYADYTWYSQNDHSTTYFSGPITWSE